MRAPVADLPHAVQASPRLEELRVLIAHDWIWAWGGAERCIEQVLRIFPKADLVVGMITPEMRGLNEITRGARETWFGRLPGARRHHRWFLPMEGLAFATLDTRSYDLVISSCYAFSKMVRPTGDTRHLCYCYTPPRFLWDQYDVHKRAATGAERLALLAGVGALRRLDRWSAQQVDHFAAISQCVADRIERWYGRRADVIFPPVVAKVEPPGGSGRREDFLLSLGRLVPYKRVDLAIAAAERLGMRLVVAGDGPERPRLERQAGPRTEFLGQVSEEEAGRLLSTCRLFVFCADEEFGITPLEAHAHGTPVVAYARGGVAETMQPHVTAEFFDEQTAESLVGAVKRALERDWNEDALRRNARRFGPDRFREAFTQCVRDALTSPPRAPA